LVTNLVHFGNMELRSTDNIGTPTRVVTDNNIMDLGVHTPTLGLLEPNVSDMNVHLDGFMQSLLDKPPGTLPRCVPNTKKRRKEDSNADSPEAIAALSMRIDNLEKVILDFTKSTLEPNPIISKETNTDDIHNATKENRNTFYSLFGKFKTIKQAFTKDQLKARLPDQDFQKFKDVRTKLTNWLKTGLAISRQIEILNARETPQINLPPLLTLKHFASTFGPQFEELKEAWIRGRDNLYRDVILEANNKLSALNDDISELLNYNNLISSDLINAKAFKSASFSAGYLFKNSTNTGVAITRHTLPPDNTVLPRNTQVRNNSTSSSVGLDFPTLSRSLLRPPPTSAGISTLDPLLTQHPQPTNRAELSTSQRPRNSFLPSSKTTHDRSRKNNSMMSWNSNRETRPASLPRVPASSTLMPLDTCPLPTDRDPNLPVGVPSSISLTSTSTRMDLPTIPPT
jgi:hypothetical protein